jgi:hypothetical protein
VQLSLLSRIGRTGKGQSASWGSVDVGSFLDESRELGFGTRCAFPRIQLEDCSQCLKGGDKQTRTERYLLAYGTKHRMLAPKDLSLRCHCRFSVRMEGGEGERDRSLVSMSGQPSPSYLPPSALAAQVLSPEPGCRIPPPALGSSPAGLEPPVPTAQARFLSKPSSSLATMCGRGVHPILWCKRGPTAS